MGKTMRSFFGQCLEMAGVKPEVAVTREGEESPLPGYGVFPFRHGSHCYYGLAPDLKFTQDALGEIRTDVQEGPRHVILTFPTAGHIYDVRKGQYLGKGKRVAVDLEAFAAPLYAVTKTKARGMKLSMDGKKVSARLSVSGGKPGERVFRFDVLTKGGKRVVDAGANVVARGGLATWTTDGTLPKNSRIVCRDVATGVQDEIAVKAE